VLGMATAVVAVGPTRAHTEPARLAAAPAVATTAAPLWLPPAAAAPTTTEAPPPTPTVNETAPTLTVAAPPSTTVAPAPTTTEPEPEPEPTTTTEAPYVPPTAPTTTEPPEPPTTEPPAPLGGGWAALRQCESGGNYATHTGNGYSGAYQFDQRTWDGTVARMGRADLVGVRPAHASPAEQDQAALQLYAERGSQPWPECGRYV
jgi:hypothetical protein